ncbi:hypothetical protein C2S51_004568 [Perilla frutescens var. frutescens]|nr:hypothetical protein C2S51_004568 [Perilla frutescens var. frutescens]
MSTISISRSSSSPPQPLQVYTRRPRIKQEPASCSSPVHSSAPDDHMSPFNDLPIALCKVCLTATYG